MRKLTIFLLLSAWTTLLNAQWVQTNGLPNNNIVALAVSPNGAGAINLFAGTSGFGVYRSVDNGASWTAANTGMTSTPISSLAVAPYGAGGSILFAATFANVFHSIDNGTSWTAGNTGLPSAGVEALAVIGTHVFAGTYGAGVFRSTDNGISWTDADNGLAGGATDVRALAAIGPNLFAGTAGSGVYLSTDYGDSWTAVNSGMSGSVVTSLTVSPNGAGGTNLFAGTTDWSGVGGSVLLSTNNGMNWTALSTVLPGYTSVHALAVYGTDIFAGVEILGGSGGGGVFRSTNNGTSWTDVGTGLPGGNTSVYALAINNLNLLAGIGDWSGGGGVWLRALSEFKPAITSFAPTSGPLGTTVTIMGSNFSATASNNIVYFGAVQATVTSATSTSLSVTVPTGASYAPITVTVNGFTTYSQAPFIVTFPGGGSITASSFATMFDFNVGTLPHSVAGGDLDNDGKMDIVVTNNLDNTISILRNTTSSGSISFAAKIDLSTALLQPRELAVGDIDGDGKLDIVVSYLDGSIISVYRNTSTPGSISLASKADVTVGSQPKGIAIGDIDGDGKPDLAVANHGTNSVSVLRNTSTAGSISFATKVDFTVGSSPYSVAIGDVDGDGKPDLVVSNEVDNTLSVLRNTSSAGNIWFATKVDFAVGPQPRGVVIGDIDGDGKPDVAVANNGLETVSVLRNLSSSGTISFAPKLDLLTPGNPNGVTAGDLDGDGKIDFAVPRQAANVVSLLRNTSSSGNISLASSVDLVTTGQPFGMGAVGDVDGDGKPDVIVANTFVNTAWGNSVSVLRNTIGYATKLVFGQQPRSAVAGASISPAITVQIQDASGNLVSSDTRNVTLAIGTNPGGGILSGTATVAAVGGIATFSNLSIDKAGTGYTLGATSVPSLTGATSSAFNITASSITYTISGNAGIAGATLSYKDDSQKTATADGTGAYSFTVSGGWIGIVTPSLGGDHFTPPYRSYSNVSSDQGSQNYILAVASELQQIVLAQGYSAEYFYRNSPRFDGIAARGDGKLLVVLESGSIQGVYLATKGQWWNPADAYSSVGAPFDSPDDMVFDRTGFSYVVDNGSEAVIRIPAGGGVATPFITRTNIPTFDPLGITIAPASFSGANVKPGDLIVADNALGGSSRAVWAIDPSTGNVRGAIAQGVAKFNDGPLQVAFGLDGRLFVYENSNNLTTYGRLVTLDAAGNVTPFLTNIPGNGNLAIHPVTGEIFFSVWRLGVPGAKILRIPAKITPPQTYPGSAVEVASGFKSLQDIEFSPDGNTLFVSAQINTTWDILAISTPPQLTVDWYQTTPTDEDHMFRGIAVDKTSSRLYICDAQTDRVYIYPNNGSNVPIGSFGDASWQTTMLGPYGIDVSDDDLVYIAVAKSLDAGGNPLPTPEHSLWRWDGTQLSKLCDLPDFPRDLHVSGTGTSTVVYVSGSDGKVIRCTPNTSNQFVAQVLFPTGILQNQQDVVANRAQSSIYVSSWYGTDSPYMDPVTKWNAAGQRDVGFSVGCARRGNTPGIDFDRSESSLYLFNIQNVPTGDPPGVVSEARLYKVDAATGSGISCVTVGPGGMAGGGLNVGRDGKIYVARTFTTTAGKYQSSWGRVTDLAAATAPEFQAPAGTVSEVFAEGVVRPIGLAVDAQHRLLVAESGTGNIYRCDSKTSKTLLANGFGQPFDIAFEGNTLFVSDLASGKIYKKDISTGTLPFAVNSFTVVASNLSGPTYLIPGSSGGYSGKLFASTNGGASNGSISQIDVSFGNTTTFMGIGGAGNVDPLGMVLAPSGEMYVCIQSTGKVSRIPSNATPPIEANALPSALEGLDSPAGIALGTDDRLYVATKDNIVVSRRDSKTWTLFVAGLSGGMYNNIEYAGNGEFYIADYLGDRILRVALPKSQTAPAQFPIVYMINEVGHPDINDGSALTAIRNAFQHWTGLSACQASFKDGGTTSARYASMTDGVNLVTFTDDQFPFPPGVLAVAAKTLQMDPGQQTATIIDADVVFNPEFVRKTMWGLSTDTYPGLPDSVTFDIESIATHEIGHILGLVHSGVPTASMFFVLQPRKEGRTLEPDDLAWAGYRYPTASFTTSFGSINGTVYYGYDDSKKTTVAGALLLAVNNTTNVSYHAYSDEAGHYRIPGLPAGDYKVLIRALNGKVFGYPMTPGNVSAYLAAITKITDYPGEWYNQGDAALEDPNLFTLVKVNANDSTTADFVTNKDVTAPSVAGVFPVNSATDVDVFTQVILTFSEAVSPASITGTTLTVSSSSGSVAGTFLLLNNNTTLTFTPAQPLQAMTTYTITASSGITDLKGNKLTAFSSGFKTGQPDRTSPAVVQVVPENSATGVYVTSPIVVRFSKSMEPTTITTSTFTVTNSTSIAAKITVTEQNTIATLTPAQLLTEGTTYTVHVTTGAKDPLGKSLPSEFTSTFTTVSNTNPTVVAIGPTNNATGISVMTPILVDFSKPIDINRVNAQTVSLTVAGSPVGGTFEFLNENARVVFRPSAPLLFGTLHQINVSSDIKDMSGRPLGGARQSVFTTEIFQGTPTITSIDPPAAPAGTTVVIAGSGFDPDPTKNIVTFNNIIAGASSSSLTSTTVVVPDGVGAGIINVQLTSHDASAVHLFDVLMPLLNPQDIIIAGASTGSQPKDAEITPDGTYAYVANFGSNTVSVIGLASATPTVGQPIPVGKNPYRIAITPDGKWAYVTNYGSSTVSVIDIATNRVTGTIAVGMNPMGIAVTPDGSRIYVANSGSNTISVIDGDPNSGAFNQIIAGASTNSSPKDVDISPDGTLAFVTAGNALLIIDINPASATFNSIIGQASTSSETKDVAITPDGTMAVVTTKDGSVMLVNVYPKSPGFGQIIAGASTNSEVERPAPSPDGTRVYVTSRSTNSVLVYDLTYTSGVTPGTVSGIVTTGISLKFVKAIPVGSAPGGIAIDPHYQKVVVVNSGSNNVSIVSVSGGNDVVLPILRQLVKIQELIDKPGTSKQDADHLKKALGALGDALGLITGGDVSHAFDRFREVIHELGLASPVVVSDIIGSLAQAAAKLVQDALTAARAFPATSQVNKQIADAEADVQKAKAYESSRDFENAMTSYKNAWDKAQLAIKLAQQTKGPNGGKPQGQDQDALPDPTELALGQNYPNPFNSTTQIVFDIPGMETGGLFVELKVYNILGQLVRTLVNEVKAPGRYIVTWNGKRDDGSPTASGMYLVSFKAGKFQQTRRVVLIQ